MTSHGTKFALLAQVVFVIGMLILAIGFAHLLSYGGNTTMQVIENHSPFAWAFVITTAASIIFGIVATVLNLRTRTK